LVLGSLPSISLFSAALFGVELHLLLECRRGASWRALLPLPLLFLLWANLLIDFVFGLMVLGIFVAVMALQPMLARFGATALEAQPTAPVAPLCGIAFVSTAVTFVNPYGYALWQNAGTELYSSTALKYFTELKPMEFRQPADYLVLLLAMSTFVFLGVQRSRDLFKYVALAAAMALAFRMQRDVWCLVLLSVGFIGELSSEGHPAVKATPRIGGIRHVAAVVIGLLFVIATVAAYLPASQPVLLRGAARVLPLEACNFMKQARPAPPIFNSYRWGGFLAWYLPEYPASVDARVALFGEEATAEHFKTVNGERPLNEDPVFSAAHTLLLEKHSKLATALTTIPVLANMYHVAYSDDVAIVFTRS